MIILKTLLVLSFLKVTFCDKQTLFKDIYEENIPVTSKCIKSVVQKSFPCGTLITLVNAKGDIDLLLSHLSKDDCYSFIIRRYKKHNWLIPTQVYILIARTALHFSIGMSRLITDIFWDSKAPSIILIEQQEDNDVEEVFDVMLRFNSFSAILIRRISNDNVAVYTYYPFNGTNCGLKYDYANISSCDDNNKISYFSNEPLSLRNCNITVVANKDVPNFIYEEQGMTENGEKLPGLEQFILETIAEKEGIHVNYNLVTKELGFGVVLPNNTATGLLNFLQRDEVDIAAGGIILIKNRIDMFDYIWGYNYATFNLFTPTIGEEIWKDVYKEFSLKTWMLIVLTYCTFTVLCMVVKRWKTQIINNHTYLSLKLWGYLYMNTSKTLSNDKRMRILMISWIWFTFFICNFYNTALYSLLTGRDQIKRQISVDDLYDLPFEPCISESTRIYFQFALNNTIPTGRNLPECKFTDTALDYVSSGNYAYAIEMEYIYKLSEHRYLDDDGRPKMDAWTFSTSNVIVMYLTRGFPMTEEFQVYAWKLYESGILKEHLKKLHHKSNIEIQLHKRHFKKILLADLRVHFFILAAGAMLSSMCFIFEIIWFRK